MKKRLLLLLTGFIAFYYFIQVAYDMPDLIHGTSKLNWLPRDIKEALQQWLDLLVCFLFALVPYQLLFRFYTKKKIWYSIWLIAGCIPAILLLRYWTVTYFSPHLFMTNNKPVEVRLRTYFLENLFYALIYSGYSIIFYFIRYAYYKELQEKELLFQNRLAELSFLRSQVNPHFLFNNLNNIYSLVYHQSELSLQAIAGLSDLLRYMLYDANEKVPMEKEIVYIKKYIELQRLRFEQCIKTDIEISGDTGKISLPPLLLIPFVENAFKHGDFSDSEHGLIITIQVREKNIYFHCYNKKGKQLKDAGGGIGLENVKRRLALLYPEKYMLSIEDTKDFFSVNLELTNE